MKPHHVFVLLSVTTILGGCDSEQKLDERNGQGTGQEMTRGGAGAGETEILPGSPPQQDPATPKSGETPATGELVLADPCLGATGSGTYKGYTCENSSNFITAEGLSCQEARRRCSLKAAANPETSFYCTWNDRLIHRQDVVAGACNPQVCQRSSGTGRYRGFICGSHNFIITDGISCQSALDNCALNASLNPTKSFFCTWNDTEIFRKELVVGICNGLP